MVTSAKYESGHKTENWSLGAVRVLFSLSPTGSYFLLEDRGPGLHVRWVGRDGRDLHPRGAPQVAESGECA